MTDQPDTLVVTIGEDMMDQMVLHTVAEAYRAMTHALLGTADEHDLANLRGMARIGLETPPEDEYAVVMHGDVMEVLRRCNLEPATAAEVEANIASAITRMMAEKENDSHGPTLVQ